MTENRVTITNDAGKVILSAPYHPEFPARAKALGGKYNGMDRTWAFDIRDENRVREMARSVYGTDGSATQKLVTVQMTVKYRVVNSEIWLFGRLIAKRRFRDQDVQLGNGVILVIGGFHSSGGSHKYPSLIDYAPNEPIVLEIRDVPEEMALQAIALDPEALKLVDVLPTFSNPLEGFSDTSLIDELSRRGYQLVKASSESETVN